MATEICPNEGKLWTGTHAISTSTVFPFLLKGVSVGAGTIVATSTLASLQVSNEASGTGYARQTIVLGAMNANGILVVPQVVWNVPSVVTTNWPTNVTAWGIASAASNGQAIFIWDLSTTRDMSVPQTTLTIPALNWFFINPGE